MKKINLRNTVSYFLERILPVRKKEDLASNLKRNLLFPMSALFFFCLNATLSVGYMLAVLIAFAASIITASQIRDLFALKERGGMSVKITSFLCAVGICLSLQSTFRADWSVSSKIRDIEAALPFKCDIPGIISVILAVGAVGFVYVCVRLFLRQMKRIFADTKIAAGISRGEIIAYSLLILSSLALMTGAFLSSQAFYGTDFSYDIIYTSDSPSLIQGNAYMSLTHPENDLRQPLFAVFSAPFTGIPYLIGRLFSLPASVSAMLLNSVQILMLFAANFMLAKMMDLNGTGRICFMVLSSITYTHLLFVLMMEQYIIAYFWLIFCIYLICEKKPERLALWGAGGTLLTSLVLLPAMSDKSPVKNFKAVLSDTVKYGLGFAAFLLMFGRFDVIWNLWTKISELGRFTGQSVTWRDKLFQYTGFVQNYFIAPDAGVNTSVHKFVSWQLNPPTRISAAGIVILILCLISAWLNREKKSSRFAAFWMGFSVIMLFCLGWGTKENGLILYSLYFGWAFLALLFQLVCKIGEKLRLRFLVPALTALCAAVLAFTNIPAIAQMIRFAVSYYPV